MQSITLTQFEINHIKAALMQAGTAQASYALKLIGNHEPELSAETQVWFDHMHEETSKHGCD